LGHATTEDNKGKQAVASVPKIHTLVRRPRALVSRLRPSARRTPKNAESFTDPCTRTAPTLQPQQLLPKHSTIAYQNRNLGAQTPKLSANRKKESSHKGTNARWKTQSCRSPPCARRAPRGGRTSPPGAPCRAENARD